VPAFELIIVDQSFAHPHCRLRFFFILFFLSLSPFIIVAHYTMLPKPYLNAIAQKGGHFGRGHGIEAANQHNQL
jgi:hypothetical protein